MTLTEQCKMSPEQVSSLGIQDTFNRKNNLGISRDLEGNWWTSYIIGAETINSQPLQILPKLDNIDFMTLFVYAIMYQPSSKYFSNYYDIKWDEKTIISSRLYDILSPLLIVQYLTILKKLVGRGLKKDYILEQDNLHSKIRGRILPLEQFRKNIVNNRNDFFYCRYQEFSENIPMNRLLKRALDVSLNILGDIRSKSNSLKSNRYYSSIINVIESFRNVDSKVNMQSVKVNRFDKLNPFYYDAIKLAKLILRHQENSITKGKVEKKVPPFWIDMSRLFEIYVLGKLTNSYANKILFQVPGSYYTQCDYLHTGEYIIVDAKYKPWYETAQGRKDHYHDMISDIREISGYARDEKLLTYFNVNTDTIPCCLIVHPGVATPCFNKPLKEIIKTTKIEGFKEFYHLGISLPCIC